MLPRLRLRVKAVYCLGLGNIARVAWYRTQLRAGIGPARTAPVAVPNGVFFELPKCDAVIDGTLPEFKVQLFGWKEVPVEDGGVPDWFLNAFTGARFPDVTAAWHRLPDFDPAVGDIKCIWELSRWDWLVQLAQHAVRGDAGQSISKMNFWLKDWLEKNPGYAGPNWKCGQEASIRVLHLALAARILDQVSPFRPALSGLLLLHLNRIEPTVGYAIGQDNNHGTSEAAALFVGGSWLARNGPSKEGERLAGVGRRLLENRVKRLIMEDGTFSQYSVNYHRLMLDTLCFAEIWRREFKMPPFSQQFYGKAALATQWLHCVVDAHTGDVPNIGANDGARLFPLLEAYRDFRPSVQLAAALFLNARAYGEGRWDAHLAWLNVSTPEERLGDAATKLFDAGGLAVLRRDDAAAYVRFPRHRFRPGHADALHVDLWIKGQNILSDGGTYSYNSSDGLGKRLAGTAAHNTICFDGRDQMPRISRFLFGAWLEELDHQDIERGSDGALRWRGRYRDWMGVEHARAVELTGRSLVVTDDIRGFQRNAVLRWRLPEGDWRTSSNRVSNGCCRFVVRGHAAHPPACHFCRHIVALLPR